MISLGLMMGFLFISKMIIGRANKKLDSNKKAELVDLFSQNGKFAFGLLIIIIGGFLRSYKISINGFENCINYICFTLINRDNI